MIWFIKKKRFPINGRPRLFSTKIVHSKQASKINVININIITPIVGYTQYIVYDYVLLIKIYLNYTTCVLNNIQMTQTTKHVARTTTSIKKRRTTAKMGVER